MLMPQPQTSLVDGVHPPPMIIPTLMQDLHGRHPLHRPLALHALQLDLEKHDVAEDVFLLKSVFSLVLKETAAEKSIHDKHVALSVDEER